MTSFVPGPEKFTIVHSAVASASSDNIVQAVVDTQYLGAELEVTTTGTVSSTGSVSVTSKIFITRSGDSGGVAQYSVAVVKIGGVGPSLIHNVSQSGSTLIVSAGYSAAAAGSVLTHYVAGKGDKLRMKVL